MVRALACVPPLLPFAALVLVGCGGGVSSSPSPSPTPTPSGLQVGGAYQITPTLQQDGCGGSVVAPGPAQVAHAPGAAAFQLTHAGNTYSGRVDPAGAFTTDPLELSQASGGRIVVRVEGRFSTAGFDATVTVEQTRPGVATACQYVVRWQAAKQGAPNVIPS